MKHFRFYEEWDQPRWRKNAKPTGNVVALYVPEVAEGRVFVGEMRECVGAVSNNASSPCVWSDASMSYISKYCKRVNEAKARESHPGLFEFLEKHRR